MEKDSKTLALEAIASLVPTSEGQAKEQLALAVAIAQIELAKDYDEMQAALDNAIARGEGAQP